MEKDYFTQTLTETVKALPMTRSMVCAYNIAIVIPSPRAKHSKEIDCTGACYSLSRLLWRVSHQYKDLS